jgi:NAD(P)-dependent dehydrogenase (short-subunit alcohol dehydrogenase family)
VTGAAVVFGARNLGRAVIEDLMDSGWPVVAVARSDATLAAAAFAGAEARPGDVTDPASVTEILAEAAEAHGRVDVVVNAASAYGGERTGPFGGGPIADAAPDAFDAWAAAPARSAFTFLRAAGRFALDQGGPCTLLQVTGGSARRPMPGRGLWAAGAFGVRAITLAAAQELRPHGIHCALLIVDAGIAPIGTQPSPAQADPRDLARAVRFLAEQGAQGATHELQVTPLGETWVP